MRLSPSLAKILIQKSPLHAFHAANNRQTERSDSMRLGALVDRLVFGVGDEIVTKTKRGEKEQPGTILASDAEVVKATQVATAAINAVPRLRKSMIQPRLVWHSDGVECSGRPDHIDEDYHIINDLKTAHDLSDDALTYAIEKYGYDIQAAAYLEGAAQKYEWDRPLFRFIFVETEAPFDVRIIEPDALMLSSGAALWRKAVATWGACMRSGEWPGRGNATLTSSRYRRNKDNDEFASTDFVRS